MKMFINEYESDSDGNLINFKAELEIMAEHVSEVRPISPICIVLPFWWMNTPRALCILFLTPRIAIFLCLRVRTGSCSFWARA